jgi:hypothetical protein
MSLFGSGKIVCAGVRKMEDVSLTVDKLQMSFFREGFSLRKTFLVLYESTEKSKRQLICLVKVKRR